MSRPLRIQFNNAVYHIMNRGSAKQTVFLDEYDYLAFLSLLDEISTIYGVQILSYCLLPNHYHLLLRTPEGQISKPMQYLNSCYTQRFNKRWGRDGSIFRGRFKSIIVDTENYLLQVSRYIHLNPVEGSLVNRPEDYIWSSYGSLINKDFTDFPICDRNFVLKFFGQKETEYKEFVKMGNNKEIRSFYQLKQSRPVLGDKNFKVKIYKMIKKFDNAIPEQKRILNIPEPKEVIEKIAKLSKKPIELIMQGRRGEKKYNFERGLAIYLCRIKSRQNLKNLAKIFQVKMENSISAHINQFKRKICLDSRLRMKFQVLILKI